MSRLEEGVFQYGRKEILQYVAYCTTGMQAEYCETISSCSWLMGQITDVDIKQYVVDHSSWFGR